MRNTIAQAKRVLQQFSHDPRTIILFVAAPVLILWLFSAILGAATPESRLGLVDLPAPIVEALDEVADTSVVDGDQARDLLADHKLDAVISLDETTLAVEVEGTSASATALTLADIQTALKDVSASQSSAGASPTPVVEVTYLHGDADWTGFDYLGPVFIGLFIFAFVFITAGMSLVTERTGGTMERLLVTPIRSWQLVAGYCLGFGVVSILQAAIVLAASIWLIGFPIVGNVGLVIFTTFSMAMASMTLGLLVSALAKTAFQVIQLMIMLVVPQLLLSGIFDLAAAPQWMQILSVCFPIRHGADALRSVMLRGDGLASVGSNLIILWGFIAVFFALSCLSFATRRRR